MKNIRFKKAWLLLVVGALAQAGFAAQILRVVPSEKGFGVRDHTEGEELFASASARETIQYAVDQLSDGGEVILPRGCFFMDKSLTLSDGVTLTGQGRGTELRFASKSGAVVTAKGARDVTLRHLAVTSKNREVSASGIFLVDTSNARVDDVLVVGFPNVGIHIRGGTEFRISDSLIVDNDYANIFVEETKASSENSLIEDTMFLWGGSGVRTENAQNLVIESCVVQQIFGVPLDLDGEHISVVKTRAFYAESDDADVILRGTGFTIENNIFCWGRGNGIAVDGASDVLITKNNIIDHGTPPGDDIFKSGVLLRNGASSVTVRGNAIWNWDDWTQGPMRYGIEELTGCKDNTFVLNTIQFYNQGPVFSEGTGTTVGSNVFDPGYDDGVLLPDFDVWREYIRTFIDEELQGADTENRIGMDYTVALSGKTANVLAGSETLFSSADAAEAIQWAIDRSSPQGGSVTLGDGWFELQRPVVVKKNVWLRGQGDETVLRIHGSADACVIVEHAPQAKVTDMKLAQSGSVASGVKLYSSVAAQVKNVTVEGFSKYGVNFAVETGLPDITWGSKAVSSLALVKDCTLANNWMSGVEIPHHGGYIGNAVPMLITDNLILGGGLGINCFAICGNLVNNVIANTREAGIIQNGNSILTTGNIFYRCGGSAVLAFDAKQFHAYHPTYDRQDNNNNKECNITDNWMIDSRGHAVEVSEQWGVIAGNVMVNTGVGNGQRYGVWLHEGSETYAVLDNDIFNTPSAYPLAYGVVLSGFNNLVAENRIRNVKGRGVKSFSEKSLVIDNSVVEGAVPENPLAWSVDKKINASMRAPDAVKHITSVLEQYKTEMK